MRIGTGKNRLPHRGCPWIPTWIPTLIPAPLIAGAILAAALPTAAFATVVNYMGEAESEWHSAAGAITTLGVPDIPLGYPVPWALSHGLNLSGAGLTGGSIEPFLAKPWGVPLGTVVFWGDLGGETNWAFTQPIATAFAFRWLFFAPVEATVWYGNTFLGSVNWPAPAPNEYTPNFYGLTSTEPFNRVIMFGYEGPTFGHSIMFSQIPSPGALALLVFAPIASRRRR